MSSKTLSDDDVAVLVIIGILAAPFLLGTLAPNVTSAIGTWMLTHQMLAPQGASLVTIPGTSAGLDARRLGIVTLLVLAAVLALKSYARTHRQSEVRR